MEGKRLLALLPRVAHVLIDIEVEAHSLSIPQLSDALLVCTRLVRIKHRAYGLYNDDGQEEASLLWLPHGGRLRHITCLHTAQQHLIKYASHFTALSSLDIHAEPSAELAELRFPHLTRLTWLPSKACSFTECIAFLRCLYRVSPALTSMHAGLLFCSTHDKDKDWRTLVQLCVELDSYGSVEQLSIRVPSPLLSTANGGERPLSVLRRELRWLRLDCC